MAAPKFIYQTLAEALNEQYRTDDLKQLASLICDQVPTRKDDRIEAIVRTLFNNLETIFNQMRPIARHAVAETIYTWGGFFEGRMFVAKYSATPWPPSEHRYKRTWDLLHLFLIDQQVPVDLQEKLKIFLPRPAKDAIRYSEHLPDDQGFTVRKTSGAALANLGTVLKMVNDNEMRVSAKTGIATKATVDKLSGRLYEGDWYDADEVMPMQSFAWPLLLQGGGLAKLDGSSLTLTPAGSKALKNNLADGIRTAWKKWEKTRIIDEFSRVTAIKGQKSNSGRTMTSPVKRRPMINALLEDLEPGQWVEVDELGRMIQLKSQYSFGMVNSAWKLYFVDQYYGHLDYNDTWPLLQFRYLLIYLFEYCATLGLIDVAYKDPVGERPDYGHCWGTDDLPFLSHCDGLHAVRVNELGAFVLGHSDCYEEKNNSAHALAFDGQDILSIGKETIPPGLSLFLEQIAEPKEIDRWGLSAATLLKAVSSGEDLDEIRTQLQKASSMELSREIEGVFTEVEQRSTAFINVGLATLIECTPELRKQVLTHNAFNNLCLPAGENFLAVIPGKEALFTREVEALGYIIGVKKG